MTCQRCSSDWVNNCHVAVVIPLYRSADNVEFIGPYLLEFESLLGSQVEVIIVSDGDLESTISSLEEQLHFLKLNFRSIRLKRNYGVSTALHEGLLDSNSCVTIVIGADLQEPLSLLIAFVNEVLFAGIDIVLGNRISREENFISKSYSRLFWFYYRKLIDPTTPKGGFDVFGISLSAKKQLDGFANSRSFILGQVSSLHGQKKYIGFERQVRSAGKSSWSIRRKIGLFFRVFLDFSNVFAELTKKLVILDCVALATFLTATYLHVNIHLVNYFLGSFGFLLLLLIAILTAQISNLQKNSIFMNEVYKRVE